MFLHNSLTQQQVTPSLVIILLQKPLNVQFQMQRGAQRKRKPRSFPSKRVWNSRSIDDLKQDPILIKMFLSF